MIISSSEQRPQREPSTPTRSDVAQVPHVSHPHSKCEEQKKGSDSDKMPGPGNQLQEVPPCPSTVTHVLVDEDEETVITCIRATDVVLCNGRIHAGFYTTVHHSGLDWRTENKPVSQDDRVVEWDGPIPIPSDLSATVCFEIYGSFEFQPTLGSGEKLGERTVTVQQLLDHSANDIPFTFPEDGDSVSPYSSFSIIVRRQRHESGHSSSALRVFDDHCSTMKSLSELEEVTNLGHSARSRYRTHGEKRDLEYSIEQFEHALNICPLDLPCRAVAQSNMALAKFIHCRDDDSDVSLDVPLALYRNSLAARPVGHPDRPSTLIQLATVHFARFEKGQNDVDSEQAETLLREAMGLSSANSQEKQAAMNMLQLSAGRKSRAYGEQDSSFRLGNLDGWTLGYELLCRFEELGRLDDLQQAISFLEASVRSTSVWDHKYLKGLTNLGVASEYRFRRLGKLSDLEQAISRYRDVVDLTPYGHPSRPGRLGNLANCFKARFNRLGELSDLERAISMHKDASDITPDSNPNKATYLTNLGNAFNTRFKRLGELSDLEHGISRHRDAVNLTPDGHPNKASYLNNFGNTLLTRFEHLGELTDLEQAISKCRDAVDLTPDGHPDKPTRLNNLGLVLGIRFERLGELSDLEQAISSQRDAVSLTPEGHPLKPTYLSSLGNTFFTRFTCFGEVCDLEQAISRHKDAVDLTPDGHPIKPSYLSNLGNAFKTRFARLGEMCDLEQAISRHSDVVDLTPDGHPDKPGHLSNLANCYKARFERLGELSDLEQAISRYRDSIDLTPDGHPNKFICLNNLGHSFRTRFARLGKPSDLEEAISRYTDSVDLIPDGHPDKAPCLSRLGNAFRARFQRFGELSDLEQAISRNRDAVDLTPDGHPDKPIHLNNLGIAFRTRFELLGELSDLEKAILRGRDAVDLTPDDHPAKPGRLGNLGIAFTIRFECLGEPSDLEHAMLTKRNAVDLAPDDHPDKPGHLGSLGSSFLTRFKFLGELPDLEQAISRSRDAVDLTPDGHPDKPGYLYNLANCFRVRFERLEELSDLEHAISRYRVAVDLTPDGHVDKPHHLNNLGNAFITRFNRLRNPNDLEQAISLHSHAAFGSTGSTTTRFDSCKQWISCARHSGHHTLFLAYSVAIALLPQLAWTGLSLTHRYRELIRGADVVREAAAAALDSGLPETAVEWLEQGRSIVWGELFQLRSSYDELSAVHPDHARRLRELSAALEHASAAREKSFSSFQEQSQGAEYHVTESLEQEADRHRRLAIERDKLLQEILELPGFERFLLHKEFSQLRASAHAGPVVILNAAERRCDALIIRSDVKDVILVPLPNFTLGRTQGLQNALKILLGKARGTPCDERVGTRDQRRGVNWESVLSTLWNGVVKPVLDALHFTTPGDLSRVFWCPAGPFVFLPIHAAGLYGTQSSEPGHKLSDFVVSSYIPTLSILSPSPQSDFASSDGLRILTVRQPPSDGLSRLPGVDTELKSIRAVIENSPPAQITESSVGTVEEVLSLMKEADWVHFACHGIQDEVNPTNSGLCLADHRRLKLSDIIALSRPRGGLAFLSACQTAMGDRNLSDEAIHIAAGMLFAGYGGVVGTMWSISDRLAPLVAKEVYSQLFGNGARPDYRDAARALHDAIGRLRNNKASFVEWLPFIHVGL